MTRMKIKEWFKKPTVLRIIFLIAAQSMIALLFDILGLGAGSIGSFTFMSYAKNFSLAAPFIILLYPPLLSSDGGIGVLISHLGTGLHIGTIKPQLFKNTEQYYSLISAAITIGTFSSFCIGSITYVTNLIILGANRIINPLPFLVIPMLTLTIASLISSQIASLMAFLMYKKKLNPDVFVYPTMSTVNNILSTLFYAVMIALLKPATWFTESGISITRGTYFALIPVILYLVFIVFIISKNVKKKSYKKILKQALPIQSITLTINSLTGGVLTGAEDALTRMPGLFLIYPALIDTLGDEVAIISNTTSTNLSLGTIEPKLSAIKDKDQWTNIVGVYLAGLFLHIIYGIFASIIVGDYQHIGLVLLFSIIINLLGFIIVQFLALLLIIFSFRKGLDPDNIAVPIVAALSSLITAAIILFLAIFI
ncbi:MAG: magnesium transporter [Candidatus Heimdallarchaeota archaeon]|nr:magnesium transporter [Candidatus Heimdallarchaeota archaeon]